MNPLLMQEILKRKGQLYNDTPEFAPPEDPSLSDLSTGLDPESYEPLPISQGTWDPRGVKKERDFIPTMPEETEEPIIEDEPIPEEVPEVTAEDKRRTIRDALSERFKDKYGYSKDQYYQGLGEMEGGVMPDGSVPPEMKQAIMQRSIKRRGIVNEFARLGSMIGQAMARKDPFAMNKIYDNLRQDNMNRMQRFMEANATMSPALQGKALKESTIEKLTLEARLPSAMEDIERTIEQVNSEAFGKVTGPLSSLKGKAFGGLGARIDSQIGAVRQMYGKLMEGGVLRKEDELKYKKQFPQPSDTVSDALFKIKNLKAMLQRDVKAHVQGLRDQGYSINGYEDVLEWAIEKPDIMEGIGEKKKRSVKKTKKIKRDKRKPPSDSDIDNMTAEELRAYLGE
jgi:hypothetical protein